jgi:hypothetical protein
MNNSFNIVLPLFVFKGLSLPSLSPGKIIEKKLNITQNAEIWKVNWALRYTVVYSERSIILTERLGFSFLHKILEMRKKYNSLNTKWLTKKCLAISIISFLEVSKSFWWTAIFVVCSDDGVVNSSIKIQKLGKLVFWSYLDWKTHKISNVTHRTRREWSHFWNLEIHGLSKNHQKLC